VCGAVCERGRRIADGSGGGDGVAAGVPGRERRRMGGLGGAAAGAAVPRRGEGAARGPGDMGRRGAAKAGARGVGQGRRRVHGGGRQEHLVLAAVAIHETPQGIVYLRAVS
jgi:hypothetical protein